MHRRYVCSAALALAWGTVAHAEPAEPADTDAQGPHFNVSLQQILAVLAQRFPLRYPLQGLLNLDVQTPRLQLLPRQNRLGAEMDVQAGGPALERNHQGTLAVDFARRRSHAQPLRTGAGRRHGHAARQHHRDRDRPAN